MSATMRLLSTQDASVSGASTWHGDARGAGSGAASAGGTVPSPGAAQPAITRAARPNKLQSRAAKTGAIVRENVAAPLKSTPLVVDVWQLRLRARPDGVARSKELLSTQERARAERFVFSHLHDAYVVAHAGLRRLLAHHIPDVAASDLEFDTGPHGKPSIRGAGGVEFNLSHSGEHALVAVSRGRPLGVDIEQVRSNVAYDDVSRHVFSSHEQRALLGATAADKLSTFFGTWVAKEAYIKAHGMGLVMPLSSFDIAIAPGQPPRLAQTRPDADQAARWWLLPLAVPDGYYGALVVARDKTDVAPPTVRRRTLQEELGEL